MTQLIDILLSGYIVCAILSMLAAIRAFEITKSADGIEGWAKVVLVLWAGATLAPLRWMIFARGRDD